MNGTKTFEIARGMRHLIHHEAQLSKVHHQIGGTKLSSNAFHPVSSAFISVLTKQSPQKTVVVEHKIKKYNKYFRTLKNNSKIV
jgi:hypothetical protein